MRWSTSTCFVFSFSTSLFLWFWFWRPFPLFHFLLLWFYQRRCISMLHIFMWLVFLSVFRHWSVFLFLSFTFFILWTANLCNRNTKFFATCYFFINLFQSKFANKSISMSIFSILYLNRAHTSKPALCAVWQIAITIILTSGYNYMPSGYITFTYELFKIIWWFVRIKNLSEFNFECGLIYYYNMQPSQVATFVCIHFNSLAIHFYYCFSTFIGIWRCLYHNNFIFK